MALIWIKKLVKLVWNPDFGQVILEPKPNAFFDQARFNPRLIERR